MSNLRSRLIRRLLARRDAARFDVPCVTLTLAVYVEARACLRAGTVSGVLPASPREIAPLPGDVLDAFLATVLDVDRARRAAGYSEQGPLVFTSPETRSAVAVVAWSAVQRAADEGAERGRGDAAALGFDSPAASPETLAIALEQAGDAAALLEPIRQGSARAYRALATLTLAGGVPARLSIN